MTLFHFGFTSDGANSIKPIVEIRNEKRSIWGVEITLASCRLKNIDALSLITVIERKHSHDITNMLQMTSSQNLSILIIRFKNGMGDFGSGNTIDITIPENALDINSQSKSSIVLTTKTDE